MTIHLNKCFIITEPQKSSKYCQVSIALNFLLSSFNEGVWFYLGEWRDALHGSSESSILAGWWLWTWNPAELWERVFPRADSLFVHLGPWTSGTPFQALLEFGEMKCVLLCIPCWHSWAMPPAWSAPLGNVLYHNLPVNSHFPEGTEDSKSLAI